MNTMSRIKLRSLFLMILFFICLSFTAGFSFAQTTAPVPSLPQFPTDTVSSLSAQFDGNAIGITCGLPEGLNRSSGTRCCNTNISTGEMLKKPSSQVDKFFCVSDLPGLGTVTDAIGGIIDVGCSLDPFCDSSGPSSSVDICLSDGVKLLLDKTFERSPLVALESMGPVAVPQPCIEGGEPTTTDYASASCKCVPAKEDANGVKRLCSLYMTGSRDMQICKSCASGGGYWTGIGCIKTDVAGFTGSIVGIGMGVGGAATFLCIIYAAFILQTSKGNPEKIKKAQENLRACITGLLLIIFSIFILRLIGVSILQIPGLS